VGQLLGFGAAPHRGLVDAILDSQVTLGQVAVTRSPFNLSIVLAGQTPPSPYEVLKSPRLPELLDEARANYDYVILDAPPLVSVQDCRVIARWVDGLILVVAAHLTPKRLVEEALNVVDPAKMLGFVFNGDDHGFARLYGGQRGAYAAPRPRRAGGVGRALRRVGASLAGRDRSRDGEDE
jgi:Mrp family chromosome partitioning ATPase